MPNLFCARFTDDEFPHAYANLPTNSDKDDSENERFSDCSDKKMSNPDYAINHNLLFFAILIVNFY